jgi:Cof subfamily protein (haloacid dehalogenase superfamily)
VTPDPGAPARARLAAIELVGIDIDGTVLDASHHVRPEVAAAFAAARAAQLLLVLASARSPRALANILADLDHSGPAICFSGAWTGAVDATGPLSTAAEMTLPLATAAAIAAAATAAGIVPSWHTASTWAVPDMGPTVEREIAVTHEQPVLTADLAATGAPNKILLIGPRPTLLALHATLRPTHGENFNAVFSHETYLEFLPRQADKGTALLACAAERGLLPAQIAAVGDGENDIGMIRAAGLGVAMGNAIPAAQDAAAWTIASNEQAGVADLIFALLAARGG